MRRIAIAVMSTISGLVLLFSYHTSHGPGDSGEQPGTTQAADGAEDGDGDGAGDGADPTDGDGRAGTDPSPAGSSDGGPSDGGGQASPSGDGQGGGVSGTFTGDRVQTKWGPVKVRITVKNGKIVKAKALEFPNENDHDREINSWAIPQLEKATVQAGDARIDSLSHATVTSEGYKHSLQSALDKAHL